MSGAKSRVRAGLRYAGVALAVALLIWAVSAAWPRRMRWVHSEVTNKQYYVKNMEGAGAVADRLAFMELRIREFLHKALEYAPGDARLENIRRRWNGTLAETPSDQDVAYSISKDAISVCVRSPTGALESENTSMFVLLHELAHLATDEYGHPPEFWNNMRFLLEVAEVTGAYKYEDYDGRRVTYCGRRLAGSPLACVKSGACKSELPKS